MGFMDLEKAYDRVNRGALWQVLRTYDGGGKLLNRFKSMFFKCLPCVRLKGGETECFRIDNVLRGASCPL